MQRPQTGSPTIVLLCSVMLWHWVTVIRSSRGVFTVQVFPFRALAGQASTHRWQSPHWLSVVGWPVWSGASVRTVTRRILGPYWGVMRRAFFPIHPRPARVAAILWEIRPFSWCLSIVWEAGTGRAWKPWDWSLLFLGRWCRGAGWLCGSGGHRLVWGLRLSRRLCCLTAGGRWRPPYSGIPTPGPARSCRRSRRGRPPTLLSAFSGAPFSRLVSSCSLGSRF